MLPVIDDNMKYQHNLRSKFKNILEMRYNCTAADHVSETMLVDNSLWLIKRLVTTIISIYVKHTRNYR